jgi:PPK2 family polyphosphate:nucleotide phosphotransferase
MKKQDLARIEGFVGPYRVTRGNGFRLKDFDPADTGPFARDAGDEASDKSRAKRMLADSVRWLAEQQDVLYAQDRWSVLLVFQAMDAAGKDGTIKQVMSGVNPQGVEVTSFKQPSAEELDHDWMWRSWRALPPRGHIGIFNRSYYEEVLVVKVHPELLAHQKLPPGLAGKKVWQHRYRDIRHFERYLADNGTVVLKFFLNVSKEEQKRRFMARLDEPEKNWKFSAGDVRERRHWDAYQRAYEDAIRETAEEHAPWYVVPADNKWYTRLIVAIAVVDAIARLKLHYPRVSAEAREALAAARAELDGEKTRRA